MMFPALIKGSASIDPHLAAGSDELKRRLCDRLKDIGVHGEVSGNAVSFVNDRNVLSQMASWFQIVDSGEFVFDGACIRYRISTTLALLFYSTILLIPLTLCTVIGSVPGVLGVIALWSFNVVGSHLAIVFKIRRTLRQIGASPSSTLSF